MSSGFLNALSFFGTWQVWAGLFAGVLIGYLVGALPGLSASMGMALLIPFTFGLNPVVSIVMLVTLYMASDIPGRSRQFSATRRASRRRPSPRSTATPCASAARRGTH